MKKEINISLSPKQASDEQFYKPVLAEKLHVTEDQIKLVQLKRRSIDARHRDIRVNLAFDVYVDELPEVEKTEFHYDDVHRKEPVLVIGAGPAGLFAALRLIELGYRPLLFERGKNVDDRKKDIAAIYRDQLVNPDSNFGFGEGGAGTFSDGKLYTRSKKRGNVQKILEVFYCNGASENILIDAHPHIGTNKLPGIITNIRRTVIDAGGEIYFSSRVTDLIIENETCKGIVLDDGSKVHGLAVMLATGHSARDIYELLYRKGITLEAKSFAIGVRAEHPQELIDTIQYKRPERGPYLPAAAYSFVEQVENRGVYSFCMCPGGIMVPAATAPGEMVVNGMSPSSRNTRYANSGMVVEIRPEDLNEFRNRGAFAGLAFQEKIEHLCFKLNGGTLFGPAQRMADFVAGKTSQDLPKASYKPGLVTSPLHEKLPRSIAFRLKQAFQMIDRKAKGYLTNEAVIVGVESRTSSPVRIPRNDETMEHVRIKGLYPCGEGAGYAGGIVSSAVDGERCAEAFDRNYRTK